MSIKDKINALGYQVTDEIKSILHDLAEFVEGTAPVAEVVEAVVAPEDVAVTEVVEATAEAVDAAATKSSKKSAS